MTDQELADYLTENGYPTHISRAGRSGLLARWTKFVDEVERGYKLGLEDYRNDLDLRGIIALAGLDSAAQSDDERFRRLLTATDRRVWESSHQDAFWDWGYPRNASGELLADLKSEGLWSTP
jgi:hypothetical protein